MDAQDNIVTAFSADHVVRLTSLSHGQLRYWDKTGFFRPEHGTRRRSAFNRIYSFQNVVGLKTVSLLRREFGVPLQHLRKVAVALSKYRNEPWSQIKLYVLGRQVYFNEPETGRIRGVVSGQYAVIELRDIAHDIASDAKRLSERSGDQFGRVERNRYIAHNAWVIAGTRIPVNTIRRFHDAGYSTSRIIKEYPTLTQKDVLAALQHTERHAQRA